MLYKVYRQGIRLFGSATNFRLWLLKPNYYFDDQAPILFLEKPEKIDFLYSNLIGMEYGDNA